MNFIQETLCQEEINAIDEYRRINIENPFADDSIVPTEIFLRTWAQNKYNHLFKLLNNQLIYEIPIEIKQSFDFVQEHYNDLDRLSITEDMCYGFSQYFKQYLSESYKQFITSMQYLFSKTTFIQSIYDGADLEFTIGDQKIKIQKGIKVIKAYNKLLTAANLWDYEIRDLFSRVTGLSSVFYHARPSYMGKTVRQIFDLMRDWQSQARNQYILKGNLCFSIHPMDYMTMSDNGCDWSTCMSWLNNGDYCQGTLEMMNSPYVVVVYLASSHPFQFSKSYSWNSKKWRQLFIVNRQAIVAIKSYPYRNDKITQIALDTLTKLAEQNLNYTYEKDTYAYFNPSLITNRRTNELLETKLHISSGGYMYTDIGALDYHLIKINPEECKNNGYIYYSGPSECIQCGQTSITIKSEDLICNDCRSMPAYTAVCNHCGQGLYEDEIFCFDDDEASYCEVCFNALKQFRCALCSGSFAHAEPFFFYIIEYWNNKVTSLTKATVCRDCSNDIINAPKEDLNKYNYPFAIRPSLFNSTRDNSIAQVVKMNENTGIIVTSDLNLINRSWCLRPCLINDPQSKKILNYFYEKILTL